MKATGCDIASKQLPLPQLVQCDPGDGSASYGQVRYLGDPGLRDAVGTVVAFSLRGGGVSSAPFASLNLGRKVGDDPAAVEANRHLLLQALGLPDTQQHVVNPVQVHGTCIGVVLQDPQQAAERLELVRARGSVDDVLLIDYPQSPQLDVQCDAVLCTHDQMPAILCFADCVPVALVAPDGCFCLVHSGWRGTIARIAGKAAAALSAATGFDPSTFNAYVGPHIGACCYEVDQQLLQRFTSQFGAGCDAGHSRLDLGFCVRSALEQAGVQPQRIAMAHMCTAHNVDKLFSHRAENGNTGRFAAVACRLGR